MLSSFLANMNTWIIFLLYQQLVTSYTGIGICQLKVMSMYSVRNSFVKFCLQSQSNFHKSSRETRFDSWRLKQKLFFVVYGKFPLFAAEVVYLSKDTFSQTCGKDNQEMSLRIE